MKTPILPTEIDIALRPSYFLWGWLWLFSMVVMCSVWLCLPYGWAAIISLLYGCSLAWQLMQLVAMPWSQSVQRLRIDVYGQMTLTNRDGASWSVQVLADSVVSIDGLVLHVSEDALSTRPVLPLKLLHRLGHRPSRLLILPDQADAESMRALRVWLKWGLRY